MTKPLVFPELRDRSWAEVDLNAKARERYAEVEPNPLLEPETCQGFVDEVARSAGVDFTYGGYLEDRRALWRGHYHAPGSMRHLGVDYNVPAGTLVVAAADCEVVGVFRDPDQGGGWGGLVHMRSAVPYRGAKFYLYGHLAHEGLPEVGRTLAEGEPVGVLGEPTENGGWFPHLHVQCYDVSWFRRHWPTLQAMDGYGPDGTEPIPSMPDPTELTEGRNGRKA